jgi:hypothetical protein
MCAVAAACSPPQCSSSVIHPGWDSSNARNDIALCFLDAPSRFAPVQLADTGELGPQLQAGLASGRAFRMSVVWGCLPAHRSGQPHTEAAGASSDIK